MTIVFVRRPTTNTIRDAFTLKSIPNSKHWIWCCEEMQKQFLLLRIGIGDSDCTINHRAVVNGCGLDFNYCFHCGEKINIIIEEE